MSEKTCDRCGHPDGPHLLMAMTDIPAEGGIGLCPVPGCECFSTWSLEGYPPPSNVPEGEELAEIRRQIQGVQPQEPTCPTASSGGNPSHASRTSGKSPNTGSRWLKSQH